MLYEYSVYFFMVHNGSSLLNGSSLEVSKASKFDWDFFMKLSGVNFFLALLCGLFGSNFNEKLAGSKLDSTSGGKLDGELLPDELHEFVVMLFLLLQADWLLTCKVLLSASFFFPTESGKFKKKKIWKV